MGELAKLPNMGKILEAQLEAVGIATPEALRETGSRAAWLRIPAEAFDICSADGMYAAALQVLELRPGALRGVRWHALDGPVKADLKEFYQSHKGLQ